MYPTASKPNARLIADCDPKLLVADGFDAAIVEIASRGGSSDVLAYDVAPVHRGSDGVAGDEGGGCSGTLPAMPFRLRPQSEPGHRQDALTATGNAYMH